MHRNDPRIETVAKAETRVALVVGNGAYQHTTPLANPLNEARDMTVALKAVGFDGVAHRHLLRHGGVRLLAQ